MKEYLVLLRYTAVGKPFVAIVSIKTIHVLVYAEESIKESKSMAARHAYKDQWIPMLCGEETIVCLTIPIPNTDLSICIQAFCVLTKIHFHHIIHHEHHKQTFR